MLGIKKIVRNNQERRNQFSKEKNVQNSRGKNIEKHKQDLNLWKSKLNKIKSITEIFCLFSKKNSTEVRLKRTIFVDLDNIIGGKDRLGQQLLDNLPQFFNSISERNFSGEDVTYKLYGNHTYLHVDILALPENMLFIDTPYQKDKKSTQAWLQGVMETGLCFLEMPILKNCYQVGNLNQEA